MIVLLCLVVHVPNSQDVVSVLEGESARLQCLSNSSDVSMFHFEWSSFNSNEDASVKTLVGSLLLFRLWKIDSMFVLFDAISSDTTLSI